MAFRHEAARQYAEKYWPRLKTMAVDPAPPLWDEYALRFAAFSPGVSTVITGTTSAEHLQRNVHLVQRGPLEPAARAACEAAFDRWDDAWTGEL